MNHDLMETLAMCGLFAAVVLGVSAYNILDRLWSHRERMKILENNGQPTWITKGGSDDDDEAGSDNNDSLM